MNGIEVWAEKHGISRAAMQEFYTLFVPGHIDTGAEGSEMGVQQRLRVAASEVGARLWRNNTGAFQPDPMEDRWVRYGLGNDSKALNKVWKPSDLIGITPHLVTPADVGRTIGIFTAVEVKEPSWKGVKDGHERAQAAFLSDVAARGGLAMFVTRVADYLKAIGR